MTQFSVANSTGLAGEYLVGAMVAGRFGWPYRIQPIADLGIDGEIEVLDPQGKSTGRFIKVQCKARQSDDGKTRYVQLEHYRYWSELALPVIVMFPVVADMRVFWMTLKEARPTASSMAFDLANAKALEETAAKEIDSLAVDHAEQYSPMVGLLRRLFEDTGVLDYTPPDQLDDFESILRLGRMNDRWKLVEMLVKELPELLTPRTRDEMERLRKLVAYLNQRMEAVALRKPMGT